MSANPTGPLHIGHGRGAAIGDVLANILQARGFQVQREYYINDAGNQMDTLGRSLYFRYRQELGENIELPDNHYRGEYMRELARDFMRDHGDRYRSTPLEEAFPVFTDYASKRILDGIKEDLDIFGVHFDNWFSERELHNRDSIERRSNTSGSAVLSMRTRGRSGSGAPRSVTKRTGLWCGQTVRAPILPPIWHTTGTNSNVVSNRL